MNETFSITCTAEANPPAKYVIYRDESRIVVNNSVVTSESGDLHVQTIQLLWVGQIAHVSLEVLCK